MNGGAARGGGNRLALTVLQSRPTLLLPAAIALGMTIAVTTHYMGRVDMGMFWIVEGIVLLFILAVAYVVGHAVLTFARAFTVAATIHHLAGTDRPVIAAVGQVGRRLASVVPWVFMHTMVWLVFSAAMLMRGGGSMIVPVRFEPGAASLRNNQFVYQVMFGEQAGLAQSMDRSASMVRAGLRGSRPFTFLVAIVTALAGMLLVGAILANGLTTGLPWAAMIIAATTAFALWTTVRDIIDTAAWHAWSGPPTGAAPTWESMDPTTPAPWTHRDNG